MREPVLCNLCRTRPATCRGAYDGAEPSFACDACCGHSNEDGWCELLEMPSLQGQAATAAPPISPSLAAATLGRLGGQSRSEAKRAASRANGKLGGRRMHRPKVDRGS